MTNSKILTSEEVDEIETRANAATDGWYIEDEKDAVRYGFRIYDKYHQGVCKMTSGGEFHDRPHSEFIKHARADIPALCATVQALTGLLNEASETESRCRELLKQWDKSSPDGVMPLDEVLQATLTYVNKSLAEPYAALIEHQRHLLSENEKLRGQYESAVSDFAVEINKANVKIRELNDQIAKTSWQVD